jgi:hypothetical protein
MNYLVAVLSDRIQAETAYLALESGGLTRSNMTILGQGFTSADDYGLQDPIEKVRNQVKLMASWLVPFGFLGGVGFSLATGLHTFGWAGEIGNHIVGGLCGAIGGTMGSIFVSGGVSLVLGGGDSKPYRERLAAGKYLVVVTGNEQVLRKANPILIRCDPESLKDFTVEA